MSSILKALKRLENENAARKPEYIKIDAEILKSTSSRRISSLGVVFAACAVFASGGFAVYFIQKRDPSTASTVKHPAAAPADSGVTAASPVTESVSTATRPAPPANTLRSPAGETRVASQPHTSQQMPRSEKAVDAAPQAAAHAPELKPAPLAAPPVAIQSPKQVTLKVDGIAFQDGAADSLAVVNGTTVSKGSVIEGARVEEIQKDRVKFSRGNEKFDVILDKSN